jgi:hypothetical protein
VRLFVGDVPPFLGPDELQGLFSRLARIVDVRMQGSQGCAFVTVAGEEDAALVLGAAQSRGVYAEGQLLTVARAHVGAHAQQQVRSLRWLGVASSSQSAAPVRTHAFRAHCLQDV